MINNTKMDKFGKSSMDKKAKQFLENLDEDLTSNQPHYLQDFNKVNSQRNSKSRETKIRSR